MQKIVRKGVLLAGALAFTVSLAAQQLTSPRLHITETNVAIEFNLERAQIAEGGSPSFWLKGGAADGAVTFWHGLGLAANLTGEHDTGIQNNVSLGKVAFMAGPRYTFNTSKYTGRITKKHATAVFGESLFGGVHAFDSTFPSANGVRTSAGAFSMQVGGGVDVAVAKGFGIRALETDWVHTSLPNNAGNTQNDFRIAFGVSWRH